MGDWAVMVGSRLWCWCDCREDAEAVQAFLVSGGHFCVWISPREVGSPAQEWAAWFRSARGAEETANLY